MKNLNLDIPYVVRGETDLSMSEITRNFIETCVVAKYSAGLDGQLRRQFGRIQRKIDNCISDNSSVVQLDDSEFDFIYRCVFDAKLPAITACNVLLLEEAFDLAKNS